MKSFVIIAVGHEPRKAKGDFMSIKKALKKAEQEIKFCEVGLDCVRDEFVLLEEYLRKNRGAVELLGNTHTDLLELEEIGEELLSVATKKLQSLKRKDDFQEEVAERLASGEEAQNIVRSFATK